MASESIALTATQEIRRPIGSILHDWVVTVDHKKLGILYILYALYFWSLAASKPPSCGYSSLFRTTTSFRPRSSTACSPCMAPR